MLIFGEKLCTIFFNARCFCRLKIVIHYSIATKKYFKVMTRPKKSQRQETNSPFKRLRLNVKLSQEQLAREIGVAVSTIRRWEKGQAEPTMTVSQMKKFCDAVQKNFNDLPDSLLPPNSSNSLRNGTS